MVNNSDKIDETSYKMTGAYDISKYNYQHNADYHADYFAESE